MTVTTPTVRRALRHSMFWALSAVFVLLIAIATLLTLGTSSGLNPLAADNAAPAGSKAVVEVLRQQGVTVKETSSLAATRAAVVDPDDTTVFLFDDGGFLDGEQYAQAASIAHGTVLMRPGLNALQAVAPMVAQAGKVATGPLKADCGIAAVRSAGTVSGGGSGYRVTGDAAGVTSCLDSGNKVFSLIRITKGTRQTTIVGTSSPFSNEHVAEDGNAALALGILGETHTLIWYLPTIADATGDASTLAELTPPWVSPVMILLIVTAIAAAFWRGRRMGPLVIENLPVVVRSSETMEGRARLYQKASARMRAIDSLRIGAIARLATRCGLSRSASVDDVIAATSALTGTDSAQVRALLLDDTPLTDRDLVRLSDRLLALERAVAEAAAT